jgi:hypothetical protein
MTMLIRKGGALVLGAGLVLLTGGCPLFQIEAEVKEVCMTYENLEIPPSDGSGAFSQDLTFDDLESIDGLDQLDGNVEFVNVTLRPRSGVSSLDFLDAAHVTLRGAPQSGLPDVDLVDCAGDCPSGSEVTLDTSAAVEALDYLKGDSIGLTVDVAGSLPTVRWAVDIDVCVKGKVSFSAEL